MYTFAGSNVSENAMVPACAATLHANKRAALVTQIVDVFIRLRIMNGQQTFHRQEVLTCCQKVLGRVCTWCAARCGCVRADHAPAFDSTGVLGLI
jgi:hypothetical protein